MAEQGEECAAEAPVAAPSATDLPGSGIASTAGNNQDDKPPDTSEIGADVRPRRQPAKPKRFLDTEDTKVKPKRSRPTKSPNKPGPKQVDPPKSANDGAPVGIEFLLESADPQGEAADEEPFDEAMAIVTLAKGAQQNSPKPRPSYERRRCKHSRIQSRCKECGGSSICEHSRVRSQCKECGGNSLCVHGRQKSRCKDCGGIGICEHSRVRGLCKECGGNGICEHGRQKSQCKHCGGSSICTHGRQRSHCKACGASSYCHHGRQRSQCKACGGAGICKHERRRSQCRECRGDELCKHRRVRVKCKDCNTLALLPPMPMSIPMITMPPAIVDKPAVSANATTPVTQLPVTQHEPSSPVIQHALSPPPTEPLDATRVSLESHPQSEHNDSNFSSYPLD